MICLITGGSGYIGSQLVHFLGSKVKNGDNIISLDIRPYPEHLRLPGVSYLTGDVGSTEVKEMIAQHRPEVVVHLAAIVMPARPIPREVMYKIDVEGTQRVLEACLENGVRRFITTSSGAAYGYYADNPPWLSEADPIRGNYEFAYAYHKRLIEEMLAEYREKHPELEQTIFRIGAILGVTVSLFKRPFSMDTIKAFAKYGAALGFMAILLFWYLGCVRHGTVVCLAQ